MNNFLKVAPILAALVLFVTFLGITQLRSVTAETVGTVTTRATTATNSAEVDYGTIGSEIAAHVDDDDLTAATSSVTVFSDSDSTGFTLTLALVASGNYSALFKIGEATDADASPPVIKAADGDEVKVRYVDADPVRTRQKTIDIETTGPTVTSLSPATGTVTDDDTPDLTVVVSDSGGSGVDAASIRFLFSSTNTTTDATAITPTDTSDDDGVITATLEDEVLAEGTTYVGAKASDEAGNESFFDADADLPVNQLAKIIVDTGDPALVASYTGVGWNETDEVFAFDQPKSIMVLFTDASSDLNGTVDDSDFDVEDNTVLDAEWFDVDLATSTRPGLESVDIQKAIFLTLDDDLNPDEKPNVDMDDNAVTDQAGNKLDEVDADALDRIAPTLTVAGIDPALAVADDDVEFTITSNEDLDAKPTVTVINFETGDAADVDVDGSDDDFDVTVEDVDDAGLYYVYVTGEDENGNAGTAGDKTKPAEAADAVYSFQVDTALANPTVDPADDATPTTRDPFFITIDFAGEADEYAGDSNSTVTLTKLTFDAGDILGDQSSKDNKVFLVAISAIAAGEHTLVVNAKDAAGNALAEDLSITFEVEAKDAFVLSIKPGWNLVSLPGDPDDTDIDVVLADAADITTVVSYDPTLPGGGLEAVRDADGNFAGTLETIDGTRGYWLFSDDFVDVSVEIPALGVGKAGVLPPTISISAGWNLISVIDVVGNAVFDDTVTAKDYFSSMADEIIRVYAYDSVKNTYVAIDVASDNLEIGTGYFVYSTASGTLAP